MVDGDTTKAVTCTSVRRKTCGRRSRRHLEPRSKACVARWICAALLKLVLASDDGKPWHTLGSSVPASRAVGGRCRWRVVGRVCWRGRFHVAYDSHTCVFFVREEWRTAAAYAGVPHEDLAAIVIAQDTGVAGDEYAKGDSEWAMTAQCLSDVITMLVRVSRLRLTGATHSTHSPLEAFEKPKSAAPESGLACGGPEVGRTLAVLAPTKRWHTPVGTYRGDAA